MVTRLPSKILSEDLSWRFSSHKCSTESKISSALSSSNLLDSSVLVDSSVDMQTYLLILINEATASKEDQDIND